MLEAFCHYFLYLIITCLGNLETNWMLIIGLLRKLEMLEAALVKIISQKMAYLIEFENEIQYGRVRKSKSYNIAISAE